jgi:carbon-monoxide dehydrogenase medium subunit
MSFALHHPNSIGEAVALAHALGDGARFIAGGTDLAIQMRRKRVAPAHLIDLTGLAELAQIREEPDALLVGALVTHKAIERHPAFQGRLAALAEAARVVGGHQIRNVGTVGGNIANASPAADVVAPLLALEAELELVAPDRSRRLALEAFLLGPGQTAKQAGELITQVRIAKPASATATAFCKAGRRKAMEIAIVCVAVQLGLDLERCTTARIALGAVSQTCLRAYAAERALEGARVGEEAFLAAGELAADATDPIDDVRASARYRRHLVKVLVARALRCCRRRIQEMGS